MGARMFTGIVQGPLLSGASYSVRVIFCWFYWASLDSIGKDRKMVNDGWILLKTCFLF